MPTVKALQLGDHLRQASQAPVCAVLGTDDALRSHCLRLLRDAAAPEDQPGSTVRRFEDVPAPHAVFDELRTLPFMGLPGRRVVIVERGDVFLRSSWEALARYLDAPSRTGTLILCLDEGPAKSPPDKASRGEAEQKERRRRWQGIWKALSDSGLVVDCGTPSWSEAGRWVQSEAERLRKKLTPRAAATLVQAVGPNLLALRSELEKLVAYAGEQVTIAERDVEEVVTEARSRSAFELAEAVGRGDAAAALKLCGRLLLSGESKEDIVSVMALQLRRLWQMKRLRAAGASQKGIAAGASVPMFVVRRSQGLLSSLSEDRLARQFRILAAADLESKTTSMRSSEEGVWLENLLARLCSVSCPQGPREAEAGSARS
jgi:DNA polymerase-3 subunit delta